MVLLFLDNL